MRDTILLVLPPCTRPACRTVAMIRVVVCVIVQIGRLVLVEWTRSLVVCSKDDAIFFCHFLKIVLVDDTVEHFFGDSPYLHGLTSLSLLINR
ncbi:hypothetical protein D3C76_878260 [compost metagenome]